MHFPCCLAGCYQTSGEGKTNNLIKLFCLGLSIYFRKKDFSRLVAEIFSVNNKKRRSTLINDIMKINFSEHRLYRLQTALSPTFPTLPQWTLGFRRQNNVKFHGAKLFLNYTSLLVHLTVTLWYTGSKWERCRQSAFETCKLSDNTIFSQWFCAFAFYLRNLSKQ